MRLLGLDPRRVYLDPERRGRRPLLRRAGQALEERRSHWLRWLVREPQGWDEATCDAGERPLHRGRGDRRVLRCPNRRGATGPDVRRPLPRLQARPAARSRLRPGARAHVGACAARDLGRRARASGRASIRTRSSRASRSRACSSIGWRGHDELPLGLSCADCFVAPSTDEPFGLVYLEAMACELPVIGTLSGGPPSFINVVPGEPDGWLVPPDDETSARQCDGDGHRRWRPAHPARDQRQSPCSRELLVATRRRTRHPALRTPRTSDQPPGRLTHRGR